MFNEEETDDVEVDESAARRDPTSYPGTTSNPVEGDTEEEALANLAAAGEAEPVRPTTDADLEAVYDKALDENAQLRQELAEARAQLEYTAAGGNEIDAQQAGDSLPRDGN